MLTTDKRSIRSFSFSPQLIVEISSVSPISLGYCAKSSLIAQLLGELTGGDVLIR